MFSFEFFCIFISQLVLLTHCIFKLRNVLINIKRTRDTDFLWYFTKFVLNISEFEELFIILEYLRFNKTWDWFLKIKSPMQLHIVMADKSYLLLTVSHIFQFIVEKKDFHQLSYHIFILEYQKPFISWWKFYLECIWTILLQ